MRISPSRGTWVGLLGVGAILLGACSAGSSGSGSRVVTEDEGDEPPATDEPPMMTLPPELGPSTDPTMGAVFDPDDIDMDGPPLSGVRRGLRERQVECRDSRRHTACLIDRARSTGAVANGA